MFARWDGLPPTNPFTEMPPKILQKNTMGGEGRSTLDGEMNGTMEVGKLPIWNSQTFQRTRAPYRAKTPDQANTHRKITK